MIRRLRAWLVAQGFSERAATYVLWQAAIVIVIIMVLVGKVVKK